MEIELVGGWIYVVMTSSDYNRFKIGRTRNNPLARLKTLRTGDPYVAVEAAYFVPASRERLSKLEAAIHREFGGRIRFHDESLSEWFPGSAKWACEWIECLFAGWWEEVASVYMLDQDRICKAYESDLEGIYIPKKLGSDGLPW